MLHIVLGGSADLENIVDQLDKDEADFQWVVPKSAEIGDELLLYFQHTQSIYFSAEISSSVEKNTLGKRQVYRANITITNFFDPAISLDEMQALLPEWAWTRYPRTYTTPNEDIAEKLIALALQRIDASEETMPDEVDATSKYSEGSVKQVLVNRYERDRNARAACINHYGCKCLVCGFDFGTKYGSDLEGFIHVHHLLPLADVGEEYEVDPIKDLRPVCPNCHAAIHSKTPPFLPDELVSLMKKH